jgi:hypothetical protein
MNAALIAQLIVALGPPALALIQDLISVWEKPVLTVDEIKAIVSKAQKSYEQYILEAQSPNV